MNKKKSIIILLFLLILALFSCKNVEHSIYTVNEADSLKFQTEERNNNLVWTEEIDPHTLKKATTKNKIDNSMLFLNETGISSSDSLQEHIYPSLKDFCSLDTTEIPNNVKEILNKLLTSITEGSIDETVFNLHRIYNVVIASYQIALLPPVNEWITGEPFIMLDNNTTYEIPVRLFFSLASDDSGNLTKDEDSERENKDNSDLIKDFIDVLVYISDKENPLVEQIIFKESDL